MLSSIMWLLLRFYFILQQSDFIKELHPLATRWPKIMSLIGPTPAMLRMKLGAKTGCHTRLKKRRPNSLEGTI